jgi:hypothetical protein
MHAQARMRVYERFSLVRQFAETSGKDTFTAWACRCILYRPLTNGMQVD